jgi:endonuclease/exonuclease/phosphatase family metal-dependent hydrolase
MQDQKAAVMEQVLRWRADVIALQECEVESPYGELSAEYTFVGAAGAPKTRGFVHLYVKHDLELKSLEGGSQPRGPAVQVELQGFADASRVGASVVRMVAVHMPSGQKEIASRRAIAKGLVWSTGSRDQNVLVLGDVNAKDDEVGELCAKVGLHEARYAGYSWGARGNRFDAQLEYAGPGLRYDRVLFGGGVWAEAFLVGQEKCFFDGSEFFLSDPSA